MKRVLRTAMMALLAVALCFTMLPPMANAATSDGWEVSVPIKINVTGAKPIEGAYAEFTIKALDEGAPMPFEAEGTELIWAVPVDAKGLTTYGLNFYVPTLGVYRYTVQMTGGTYFNAASDGTLYNMEIQHLAPNSDGTDASSVQIWVGDNRNTKYTSMDYEIPLRDLKVTKKWADQASTRSDSVGIDVLYEKGDAVTLPVLDFTKGEVKDYTFPTLTLNTKNSWQSSWTGLDARSAYEVKEVKRPAGYVASYKYDEDAGIWYVTNTGALLQTGQLNWPIPVLCAAGFLLMTAGVLLMKRKEEEYND